MNFEISKTEQCVASLVIMFFFVFTGFSATYEISYSINKSCFITDRWHMFIFSDINEDIKFHVISNDDDLGNHTLSMSGSYDW